ncbi:MAG: hypothetical protein GC165_08935 [Armatimonadetes bacterium]|nr:hypothetical protein [Armatimonadota bacterium]MBS1728747.1 hypothetical protein [Armatimonadota bacterium]
MSIVPFVVGYFAIQWNRANYLGKTPEQIVAMGRKKWSDLYGSKVGLSTRDMCDADEKYGIALRNLNDRAMKRLSRSRQEWLSSARKETIDFASNAHRVGEVLSGGGTIWRTFDASISPDVEQIISDCIVNKSMPTYKMKSFESQLKELDEAISSSDTVGEENKEQIGQHRGALIQGHSKLERLFLAGKSGDTTRIRLYMGQQMEEATGRY